MLAYALVFVLRGLAWPPSRKPLRKRRRTIFKWRHRPVPVVFLRLAFSDQLSEREKKIENVKMAEQPGLRSTASGKSECGKTV